MNENKLQITRRDKLTLVSVIGISAAISITGIWHIGSAIVELVADLIVWTVRGMDR